MNTNNIRHHYVIGDVQGCYADLMQLLDVIKFNSSKDKLWFAGDLVARGEDSLGVLRLVKQLNEVGRADIVLGNHDINLLAIWRGYSKVRNKDNLDNLLIAKDLDELMHWLRQQPLLQIIDDKHVMCHAGIPPIWSTKKALKLANEVQQHLAGNIAKLDALLPKLYGKTPDVWQESLSSFERLRCVTNYLTRMRLCQENGRVEFDYKLNPKKHADLMPKGFKPWYEWSNQITKARDEKILFGHWASLEAKVETKKVKSLDAGCVWGGSLLAYRLSDKKVFRVEA